MLCVDIRTQCSPDYSPGAPLSLAQLAITCNHSPPSWNHHVIRFLSFSPFFPLLISPWFFPSPMAANGLNLCAKRFALSARPTGRCFQIQSCYLGPPWKIWDCSMSLTNDFLEGLLVHRTYVDQIRADSAKCAAQHSMKSTASMGQMATASWIPNDSCAPW